MHADRRRGPGSTSPTPKTPTGCASSSRTWTASRARWTLTAPTWRRWRAADIRSRLFGAGLRAEGDGEHVAVAILKAAMPDKVVTVVSRAGWHFLPDPVFATPAGEVFGADGQALELAVGARLPPHAAKAGTLEGWQEAVSAALAVESCPHWTLGVLAGFAGPILALCRLDTCGINLSGATSLGKTTAQQLAVLGLVVARITDGGLLALDALDRERGRGAGASLARHRPGA